MHREKKPEVGDTVTDNKNCKSRYVIVKFGLVVDDNNKQQFDTLMMDAICMDNLYGMEITYKSINDPIIQKIINGDGAPLK